MATRLGATLYVAACLRDGMAEAEIRAGELEERRV